MNPNLALLEDDPRRRAAPPHLTQPPSPLYARHGLSARTSASAIIAALRQKWANVCDVEAGRLRKDMPGWWERTAETPANVVECESVEHLKATLKTTEEADKLLLVGSHPRRCGPLLISH